MSPEEGSDAEAARARRIRARVFVATILAGAVAAGIVVRPPEVPSLISLLFFFVIIAVTEALPIKLPRARGTVSVGFAMCYSAVLLFGPFWGGLLTALGSLRQAELSGKVEVSETLFNRGQLFLAAVGGGLVFQSISGGSLEGGQWLLIAATMTGGITYFGINVTAVVIYFSLKMGADPRSLVLNDIRWSIPSYMGLMPIAYLNVAVYGAVGKLGVIFFLLPLLVGRYAFQMYSQLRDVFVSTISALAAALEARDPHTSGHAERVSYYAVRIAKALQMPEDRVELLQYIAILHDIGKLGIEDQLLRKPGKFDASEMKIMQSHSQIGANILSKIKALREGASWVLHHHERYDGDGYPKGLKGEQIPLEARILAVADAFDAMLSERPYKNPMTPAEVRRELLRCRGTQFDPDVTDVLVDLMDNTDLVQPHLHRSAHAEESTGDEARGGSAT